MVHFLELVFFLLILKAILRCLYFWQLKEYRWDRFREFLKTSQARQYFLPTRWLLKPKPTLKIFLLIYLSFYFTILILRLPNLLIVPLIAYLVIPLTVTFAVFLLKPLTDLVIDAIILLAKLKMKLMPKSLKVIGVTGSYGKTSTKEILAHLLAAKHQVCKTQGTDNTAIGVAKTVLKNLKKSHQFFVVEMGAYKQGEIKQICKIVKPSIAVLTGITQQHLGLFGSLEKIIKTKYELIEALPQDGLAVFNGDDQRVLSLAKKTKHSKTITYHQSKTPYQTNLLGDYQQTNIQAAVTVAKKLGISPSTIKTRLKNIPSFKTTITLKRGINKAIIFDDTYNANPQGFKAAIKYLKTQKAAYKILITSGIIELGQETEKIHQQLAQQAMQVFNEIIITKQDIADIFLAVQPKKSKTKIVFQPNYRKLTQYLKTMLKSQTAVLLESRLPQRFINHLCQNPS